MRRELFVSHSGEVRFVHDDETMQDLAGVGRTAVARASTVEPVPSSLWGVAWEADLRRCGGPRQLFTTRAGALAWERDWLNAHAAPFPQPE